MTTDAFIDILQQQQLVPSGVIRQLREKAGQADARITPKSILKYLVKKELVSREVAKQLLETTIIVSEKAESSILGLTPLPDLEIAAPKASKSPILTKENRPAEKPKAIDELAPIVLSPVQDDLFEDSPLTPIKATPLDSEQDAADLALGDDANSAAPTPTAGKLRGLKTKKPAKAKKSTPKKPRTKGKSEWDSPLLLLGGGGLAILLVASLVLYFLLFYEGADAALKKANDAFDQGQYQVAVEYYQAFTDNYPRHKDFSQAKVRLGMSRLWEAAESRNYADAVAKAPGVLTEIENEPAFIADQDDPNGSSRAKNELSQLLTKVAQGLAEQAETAKNDEIAAERIKQLNTVLELTANTKYIPQKLRNDSALDAVRETLQRVETRERREADLAAALAQMDEAIKRGQPAAALTIRAGLLKNYPVLAEDKTLAAKVVEISKAEQAGVKFVESKKPASTEAPQSPIVAELALADRQGEGGGAAGQVAVRVDGAIYCLNTADGSLLWRRFVGLDGSALPLVLAGGSVVAVDSQHAELISLNLQTGKLQWRLALEGKLSTPVLAGERLLVASEAGMVFVINLASGELLGHVPFSQPLRVSPAVNEKGDRIYVLGEHSNIYTLSGADFSCLGVYYLGHAASGIVVPPLCVLNKVIVADNSGAESSTVRALSLDERGIVAGDLVNQRLSGRVVTPLQAAGRRFAVVTTLGEANVFEVGPGNDKNAVAVLAARDAKEKEPLAQYALLHEGHLWLSGRQLLKLAILPTGNQLPVRSLDHDYQGDTFDYPLQAIGNLLIHVRRPANQGGAIVAAMDAAANHALWETALAVPPAGPAAVDASSMRITAGVASGDVYQLDREAMKLRVQDHAKRLDAPPASMPPLTESLDLGQGRLVLGGRGSPRLVHFRPGNPRQELKAIDLPGPLTCPLVAWRDGFVAATEVGQVALHNADDGTSLATPFQPELTPGQKYAWLRPAVVGAGAESQLAVSDGVAKVYLVKVEAQPQTHLKAVASVDVGATPLDSPLAAAGSRLFAVNKKGQLVSFTLPALTPNDPVDLGGRAVWGPHAAGEGLLIANERNELLMIASDGAIRWRQSLKHGELAGTPLIDAGNVFLLCRNGVVARIALTDGAEGAFVELGQPVVAGPVALGPRLVISVHDGTLLVVNRP